MKFIYYRVYKLLRKIPFVREAVQTGFLMGTGDVIAQKFVEKKNIFQYDVNRTKQFFLIGTFFVGPPLRLWYGVLHKHFGSDTKTGALKKVAFDQILFAPIFMAILLSIINYSQSYSVEEIGTKLKEDYPDILKNNYKLWPAIQLLNFYMVPLKFQVITVQIVAVFWNTYISWKTNQSRESKKLIHSQFKKIKKEMRKCLARFFFR